MLDSLFFKVSSSSTESPLVFISDKMWFEDAEPQDRFTANVMIDIYGYEEDTPDDDLENSKIKIGELNGIYFDLEYAVNEGERLVDIFDDLSQDAMELYQTIYDERENDKANIFELNFNIFDIQYIFIRKKYRNHGIGSAIIQHLEEILKSTLRFNVGCFVTIPLPTKITKKNGITEINYIREDKKEIAQLRKFIRNCGYRSIENSEYLYKNTERIDLNIKIIK